MKTTIVPTSIDDFESFLSPDVEFKKAPVIKLSSKELTDATSELLTTLKDKWMTFVKHSHLPAKQTIDFDWVITESPEVHSFFLWKWFLNISANGTVFHKDNWRYNTVAKVSDWHIEFNDKWKELIPALILNQKEMMK